MLPNFLGIGVQRAATTWLHNCLDEHPQVFVPKDKELHFFSSQFDRGLAWYESCFAAANGQMAVGEITPTYLHEAPIERIAATLPAARLFLVLREPVARAGGGADSRFILYITTAGPPAGLSIRHHRSGEVKTRLTNCSGGFLQGKASGQLSNRWTEAAHAASFRSRVGASICGVKRRSRCHWVAKRSGSGKNPACRPAK